jgi:hypothetical protein
MSQYTDPKYDSAFIINAMSDYEELVKVATATPDTWTGSGTAESIEMVYKR